MQSLNGAGFGHLNLRALRFLLCVLERRSVTKAGEAMGLSQPAASRLLAQLRRALGDDPLLVRASGGSYVLTCRAAELIPRLRDALAAAEGLFVAPGFDAASSRRTFRVATTDYGAAVVLTPLARDLALSAPGVSLDIHPWQAGTLADLEEGQLDFALYIDLPLPAAFRHADLFPEHYACIVRRGHPVLARRDQHGRVDARRLAELPRIITLYPSGEEVAVDDPLAAFGDARTGGVLRTPYLLTGPLLVGASDRALCTTRRLADLMATMAEVSVIDLPEAGRFTYRMIWHGRGDGDDGLAWIRRRIEVLTAAPLTA